MSDEIKQQKAGFINLVGLPNSGKSTLFNALQQTKLAIVTAKPQTTRQRIIGILNRGHEQLIVSDTPGWIENAAYALHKVMNLQIKLATEDADAIVLVLDGHSMEKHPESFLKLLSQINVPLLLCVNKSDKKNDSIEAKINDLTEQGLKFLDIIYTSAKDGTGVDMLLHKMFELIPVHPHYYADEFSSDRTIRFFISEFIREQILLNYSAEIPYSCFVVIDSCKGVDEGLPIAHIYATIYTAKSSHVPILIGKNGAQLKKIGTEARKEIETFLSQKVYLNLSVKLRKDWREDSNFVHKSEIFQ